MWESINRRQFLSLTLTALSSLGLSGCKFSFKQSFSGSLKGPSSSLGHKLRDGYPFPPPEEESECPIVIVGAGIAGLSAAWWLQRKGFNDFKLLELEKNPGGNSVGGRNNVSSYPWGAHYVPIPGPQAAYLRLLLEELNVIEEYDENGLPRYNELYLCHEPEERLFKGGRWQEGLVPQIGLHENERSEIARFFALVQELKNSKGADGRPVFSIPLESSSRDPFWLELDNISLFDWLQREGFRTAPLKWYLNYCCRDDYGASYQDVSAWAGLHYFASRTGKASNADHQTVLTWPQGNHWLVQKLTEKLNEHLKLNATVYKINSTKAGVAVDYFDSEKRQSRRLHAKQLIYAAPRFTAPHVIADFKAKPPGYLNELEYAPWVVANLTLSALPEGRGAALAWDNVSYHSPSIGYVVATHQNISTQQSGTVITYYYPLSHKTPCEARKEAYLKSYSQWAEEIIEDLEKMHPKISQLIQNLDIWLWGHGMIKPSVNFIWGEARHQMKQNHGSILFAHSDMSGISIFEEAQYWGVEAAKAALEKL